MVKTSWESRAGDKAGTSRYARLYEHSKRLHTDDGTTLESYINPAADISAAKGLAESCNNYIEGAGAKRFRGVLVTVADTREFMQRFILGVGMACEAAPWDRDVVLKMVPEGPGLAQFKPQDCSIILTHAAICTYAQMKKRKLNKVGDGYGSIHSNELPFLIGAEEARHASQVYNNGLAQKIAASIRWFLVQKQEKDGKDFNAPRSHIESEIKKETRMDLSAADFVEWYMSQMGTLMNERNNSGNNDPLEKEAKNFVDGLRARFAKAMELLKPQIVGSV